MSGGAPCWWVDEVAVYYGPSGCKQREKPTVLNARDIAVLRKIAEWVKNSTLIMWHGVPDMARHTGLSVRSVQRSLRVLEGVGAIRPTGSQAGGRHTDTTTYEVLIPRWWIEQLQAKQPGKFHDLGSQAPSTENRAKTARNPAEIEQKQLLRFELATSQASSAHGCQSDTPTGDKQTPKYFKKESFKKESFKKESFKKESFKYPLRPPRGGGGRRRPAW
jgi:hypothetical protein